MWRYTWNNPNVAEDGFFLVSPADREVGLINDEVDAKQIVEMLNEALSAREKHKLPDIH